jgi:hypothetical protein
VARSLSFVFDFAVAGAAVCWAFFADVLADVFVAVFVAVFIVETTFVIALRSFRRQE